MQVHFDDFPALTKTTLFDNYFMPILILSHLFFPYFIFHEVYFISISPGKENRPAILLLF